MIGVTCRVWIMALLASLTHSLISSGFFGFGAATILDTHSVGPEIYERDVQFLITKHLFLN